MRILVFTAALFISYYTFAQDMEYPDSLPINKIQQIGSHNSYRKTPYKRVLNLVKLLNPFFPKLKAPYHQWQYSHLPLDSQFQNYGIRSIELDIYNDPQGGKFYKRQINAVCFAPRSSREPALLWPGMKMLHIADLDYNTNYFTLNHALHAIKKWSSEHPTHYPLLVMIETKDDAVGDHVKIAGFQKAIKFDINAYKDLVKEIEDVFADNPAQILRPDDVRGNEATLRDAVTKHGFPKLGDCRGKVAFIVMGGQREVNLITKEHPSFSGMPFFMFSGTDKPESAFVKLDDPKSNFEQIKAAVAQGFIVRTRADADTKEAQFRDYSSFQKAKESGAQMISTDFYKPFLKNGYVISREMLKK